MIGTKAIEDIVKTTLWTAYVEGEQPQSLFILSQVEGGKSFLTTQFRGNDGIICPHDATAYGIINDYKDELVNEKIKHFIFPEFVFPLARKKETVSTFIAFINGLIEEGIDTINTYATSFRLDKPIKAGVIACLAKSEFGWRKSYWIKMGFLSRFLLVSYSYSDRAEKAIFEAIFTGKKDINPISLKFQKGAVILPPDIASSLNPKAKEIAKAMSIPKVAEIAGFRAQQHLQRMIKALALSRGKNVVDKDDFYKLMELSEYMNLDYKKLP